LTVYATVCYPFQKIREENNMKRFHIGLYLFLISLLIPFNSHPQGLKKIAIIPFKIHAQKGMEFLKEGITDMLITRLSWKGETEIIERWKVNEILEKQGMPIKKEDIISIGRALGADYLITGSITIVGESVSVDAKIYNIKTAEELLTAYTQSHGMDEVIPTISKFADEINEKILGRAAEIKITQPIRRKQEKEQVLSPIFMPSEREERVQIKYLKRERVEARALDVGDIDGDGKKEIILMDHRNLFVYKVSEKSLLRILRYTESPTHEFIWMNVADLDKDGRAEIYLSALVGKGASASILQYQGGRLKKIGEVSNWLIRVLDAPYHRKTLIGQRRALDGGFHGDVYVMKRSGKGLKKLRALKLPRFSNVYNFLEIDFEKTHKPYTVVLNPYERLLLYDASLNLIWKSEDLFGGTLTYIEDKSGNARQEDTGDYLYLPSPMYAVDVDGDGKDELMICKNREKTGRLFEKTRVFSSGQLVFFQFDKTGLRIKWKTKKITGPIVGYRIADVDGDKREELVVSSVIKQGFIKGHGRSQILIYQLR